MAAGFRGTLFLIGLSSGAVVQQASFRSPLPLPPLAGVAGVVQAGYIGIIPIVNLGTTAGTPLPARFNRLSTRDIQYEALRLVVTPSDSRTMEREYWFSIFGGNPNWSTLDIMHEGIIKGLSNPTLKDYYDGQTANVWPDHNSSERAFWLKIIADNI